MVEQSAHIKAEQGSDTMTVAQEKYEGTDGTIAGRVALVTGGTAGIGGAISRRLAGQGAGVAAGYWRNPDRAEDFRAKMLGDFPDQRFSVHQGNIGVAEDCRRVVEETIDQHGRLDILINNAGITIDKTVAKMADEDWQRVIAVNLSGAFFMAQAALDQMIKQGSGRIVSVSSVIGETGNIGQVNYAASKSGLFGLTKSLAKEAIFQIKRTGHDPGDGIGLTVNAVTPGFIATDMLATIPEKVLARIKEQIPVGRLGQPEEIARAVCFLAADESAYITGQIWAVNGGLDM
jgi:acetoacetyl-CoA reductase/3-oxoacyl-[acyl-carrier protein] reductase